MLYGLVWVGSVTSEVVVAHALCKGKKGREMGLKEAI